MNETEGRVIPGGFCIGCGACAHLDGEKFAIAWTAAGTLQAHDRIERPARSEVDRVCPFSSGSASETQIGERVFSGEGARRHPVIGRYRGCYVGFVREGDYRARGSSGGVGKWVLAELLQRGAVDAVIQITPRVGGDRLFDYARHDTVAGVLEGSRSAYYPVTLTGALETMRDTPGRYAVTALPCFAKALRNLAENDPVLGERLSYVVGTACGHMKSAAYAKLLAWQVGVPPRKLRGIDFRGKLEGRKANDKGVLATDATATHPPQSSRDLFGGNWGWNFFKYKACDYCDDVMAETADISVGDAWLPEYIDDSGGNNVVVVRNRRIGELIDGAIADGRLALECCEPEVVARSQRGGIRHKSEGLALRLWDDRSAHRWIPKKRISPSRNIPEKRKNIYRTRVLIRDKSHEAFEEAVEQNDLQHFVTTMRPLVERLDKRNYWRELVALVARIWRRD